MEQQKMIIGEFENERYAVVANGDLELADINANIIKNDNDIFIFFSDETGRVQRVIPGIQVEKLNKYLK
jgi:hypothetical protein